MEDRQTVRQFVKAKTVSEGAHITAIVPARGGSKGLLRKNIRLLNGKPLLFYSIEEAKRSRYLDRILVSTEDQEIARIARDCGAEVIARPDELAQDDTPSLLVYQQVIRYLGDVEDLHPVIIVILQPTSPLRTVDDIDSAIQKFFEEGCDSVVSVCEVEHPPHWMYTLNGDRLTPIIEGSERITRRQDAPVVYRLNGAVYVTWRDTIMKENKVLGQDTRAYVMPPSRSVDIDTELDFELAEILIKKVNHR